jgi:recombination protein RecA
MQKSGSWFSYNDSKIGQGRDNVKTFLLDNPEMMEEVEAKIRAQLQQQDEAAPMEIGAEDL